MNHRIKKATLALFTGLVCCLPTQGWCFFPVNGDDTVTITMVVDIVGEATLTPFVIKPGGDAIVGEPVELDTLDSPHSFSPIVVEGPEQGEYTCAVKVESTQDATVVAINAASTVDAVLGTSWVHRPTDPTVHSVTADNGDVTPLFFTGIYLLPAE
jgi:hypothetical protein